MRSEQGGRRAGPGTVAAVLAALALTAGCGDGASTADPVAAPGAAVPVAGGGPVPAQQAADLYVPATVATLPDELVGSWSGDDAQGVGSWTIEFAADGRYAQYNVRRGVTVVGQAAVAGRRLYLQPQDADSQTLTWQVAGGRLSLDGEVYLRTRSSRPDEGALVGQWIGETNTWQTLTFNGNGTYEFDDGPNGTSRGRYSVSGDRLSTARSTYTWSVDGARLELSLPGGRSAVYARIG